MVIIDFTVSRNTGKSTKFVFLFNAYIQCYNIMTIALLFYLHGKRSGKIINIVFEAGALKTYFIENEMLNGKFSPEAFVL